MIFSSIIGIACMGFAIGLLVGCVAVLLLRRRASSKKSGSQFLTRFMYSGNLKQTNLLDAIQFLEIGRREGILHIYVGRRKGYITFVAGQIVDSFFRNTTGKESIFQMLELDYGDFYFESKTINQPRVITESIMDIALEWDARRYGDTYAPVTGKNFPVPTQPSMNHSPEEADASAAEATFEPAADAISGAGPAVEKSADQSAENNTTTSGEL